MSYRVLVCGVRALALPVTLMLAVGLIAAAEQDQDKTEPPVRLKKKAQPPAETEPRKEAEPRPKESDVKGRVEPDLKDLEKDVKETVARVEKNMRVSEERLAAKDTGDATQQVQRDVLKDLDSLIEQSKQQLQQQQSSSSSSSQSQSERLARRQRMMKNRSSAQRSKTQPQEQDNESGLGGGKTDRGEMNKIADLYKDVWGHLPAMLRQEMDQYAREQFMAKYSELLKQYYATIAEKGRLRESGGRGASSPR